MHLVVGATGLLGGEICRLLSAAGEPVRALVRPTSDPSRVAALRECGVDVVYGDLKDAPSLAAACSGVSTVISTATTTLSRQPGDTIPLVDMEGQMRLVDAARDAGAAQFVYVSFSAHIDVPSALVTAKRAVEQYLRASGLTHTILRPTYFMEVWLSSMLGFDPASATAHIYGAGEHGISWIARADVAAFVVAALNVPAARDATIELGGPQTLSPLDVVRLFEQVGGRRFTVRHVPRVALEAQWEAATDPLQQSMAALMLDYADGDHIPMERTLRAFPVHLTSVREYAARTSAALDTTVRS